MPDARLLPHGSQCLHRSGSNPIDPPASRSLARDGLPKSSALHPPPANSSAGGLQTGLEGSCWMNFLRSCRDSTALLLFFKRFFHSFFWRGGLLSFTLYARHSDRA